MFSVMMACGQKKESKEAPKVQEKNVQEKTTKSENYQKPSKEVVTGKINYATNSNFRLLKKGYASKNIYLQNIVAEKFEQMADEALKSGIKLVAISGARDYHYQKGIWERKYKALKGTPEEKAQNILRYSSMPMTSRHHWGTDIDINSLDNRYFASGKGLKEYQWLQQNASKYGFCQVYSDKSGGRTGYEMEKWHWSYLPIANEYLEFYNQNVKYSDFKDFSAAETAEKLQVIKNYVNGIHRCPSP